MHRPRVTHLLDGAASRPVTLVTGPAGTGKTLAVADWTLGGTLDSPVAWLSLDRGDASLPRFWTSVTSALASAVPAVSPTPGPPDVADVESLRTVVHGAGRTVVLVLDDVQEIDGGESLDALEQLVRWPPDGLRLILVSRHDPPLSLHRLRLQGQVADVRAAELAFTRSEVEELTAASGVTLDPPTLDRLVASTGGWAAALRLATLTLQISEDPSRAVERFGGLTHQVSEYLWDEVFHLLPEGYREFLLRTSVTGQLCAPLAGALSGEPDADAILRALAHEQLLAHQVEGTGWYRTHSLLTEVLRARLRQSRPELERELQRTAALWFEDDGAWMDALEHAIASRDWDFAGQVVTRSAVVGIFGPDRQRFDELVDRIPASARTGSAELQAAMAASAFCRRDRAMLQRSGAEAERLAGALPEPRQSIVRLVLRMLLSGQAHRDGDAETMRRAAEEADALFAHIRPGDAPGLTEHRGIVVALRGIGELWCGNPTAACSLLLSTAGSYPRASHSALSVVYFRGLLALAQAGRGQLQRARLTVEPALTASRVPERAGSYESQWAWLALAVTSLYAGDPAEARVALAGCLGSAAGRLNPFVEAMARILSARASLTLGNIPAARRGLAAARDHVTKLPDTSLFAVLLTSLTVDIALAEGDVEAARSELAAHDGRRAGDGTDRPDAVANCRARFLLADGRLECVRPAVAHLLGVGGTEALQAWLSVAAAETLLRRDALAIEAISRAIDLAEAEGAQLLLLRQRRQVAGALRHHREVVGTHRDLVDWALSGKADPVPVAAQCPPGELTERELAVLAYLPSMGSNAEIAAALNISTNTVKQHLKSIYRKLAVGSRREAVRAARSAGLLDWVSGSAPVP